jgi:predicted GTPase
MKILKIKGKEYFLKYNFRALSEIQDRGISLTNEQEFKLKDIALLLHIGLKKFHDELTVDVVFDLIDDALEDMTLEELMNLISQALQESMGKQRPLPVR